MLPTEDLFVYVYVMVDDAIASGAVAIPPRPGPAALGEDLNRGFDLLATGLGDYGRRRA